MAMYNTGNPVGSSAPKDLSDNAQVFDKLVVGSDPRVTDRLGHERLSWAGLEYEFDNAQTGRQQEFQDFLLSSGYEPPVSYAAGVLLERVTQTFVRDGFLYRIKDPVLLPYTLTGNWASESTNFVVIGDSGLAQALADKTDAAHGTALIGYLRSAAGAVGRMLSQKLADEIHVNDFGADPTGATDSTTAIMNAFAAAGGGIAKLKFGKGVYNFTNLNFDSALGLHLEGHGGIANTILRCTSTNSADGIKFRSTFDCTASFITFDHTSASFTGYLADMRHKPGSLIDTQGMYFFRCTFASQNYDKFSAKGVSLDQATLCTFEGCKFVGLLRPVDGQNPAGGSYSNGMRFKNCQFSDNIGYCFNFLGEQWSFDDCNFQACHDGGQRICFSDNATFWRGLAFKNCGVYDALIAGTSMLNLGTGYGLTVENGLWGGRGDLGSSTWLNATGQVIGVNVKGSTFSMFSNITVATTPGSNGWNISGGNIFIPITGQPISSTNMIAGRANAPDARFDGNYPNVSLRDGLAAGDNWRSYNPDGTYWCGGTVSLVGPNVTNTVTLPFGAVTAVLHRTVDLQSPPVATNTVQLVGGPTTSSFQFQVVGSGAATNTVLWSALVRP